MVRAPPRILPRSLAPSGVLGGGAARSRFPPTWLGVVGLAAGRPWGGCLLPLRGASGVMRSPSRDCPPTGRAVGVRDPRVVGAGVRVWGPCSVPVGAARRGAGPWRSYAGGRAGGGVRRTPRLCGRGGACRAGGRSASFRPSAFSGQATKRASLALCCPLGAWPPIPLRFVLTRLLWVRSVRRPSAQAWARLFCLPRGVGAGAPAACGPVGGGGGGGVAPRPPCSPSGRRPAVLHPGPLRVAGAFPSGVRVQSGLKCRPRVGGGEGRPVDRSPRGSSRPERPLCHP